MIPIVFRLYSSLFTHPLIYIRVVRMKCNSFGHHPKICSPGEPAVFHALKTKSTMSSTPVPCLMLVKIVGPSPLMSFASLSMTASDADTNEAISICRIVNTGVLKRQMETHLVYHEEVGVGDTRSPFPGNFISTLETEE